MKKAFTLTKGDEMKKGFTIIELLTVLSIILILLGLIVPGVSAIRLLALNVSQATQFRAINVSVEAFSAEWGDYPKTGATELAEAMVGRDLRGYSITGDYNDLSVGNRRFYLPTIKAIKVWNLYPEDVNLPLLRDVYPEGMPVLYYKANAAARPIDIYDYADNEWLVGLGKPFEGGAPHAFDEVMFYADREIDGYDSPIRDIRFDGPWTPHRMDSFILMSAGQDGEYGTKDDRFNF